MSDENEYNAFAITEDGDKKVTTDFGWTYDECMSDILGKCFSQAIRLSCGDSQWICLLPTRLQDVVEVEFEELNYVALWRPCEPDSFGLTKKEAVDNCIARLTRERDSSELWRSRAVAHLEQL